MSIDEEFFIYSSRTGTPVMVLGPYTQDRATKLAIALNSATIGEPYFVDQEV